MTKKKQKTFFNVKVKTDFCKVIFTYEIIWKVQFLVNEYSGQNLHHWSTIQVILQKVVEKAQFREWIQKMFQVIDCSLKYT